MRNIREHIGDSENPYEIWEIYTLRENVFLTVYCDQIWIKKCKDIEDFKKMFRPQYPGFSRTYMSFNHDGCELLSHLISQI